MAEGQLKRKSISKRLWSKEEDEILRKSVEQYGTRWLLECLIMQSKMEEDQAHKISIYTFKHKKQIPWTRAEDEQILKLHEQYGNQWSLFSQKMAGRSSRAIRQRYMNQLNPKIVRTEFSEQEDMYIYERYIQLGPKWSIIANGLKGRSSNQVKNRYYNKLRQDFFKINNPYFTKGQTNETEQEQSPNIEDSLDSDDYMYSHMAFYSRKYDEYE